jgi:hypothetical protein
MTNQDDFTAKTPNGDVVYVTSNIGTGLSGVALSQARHSITIDGRQRGKAKLDTFIHESLHILYPELSEQCILKSANFVAEVLWKAGYRRISEQRK